MRQPPPIDRAPDWEMLARYHAGESGADEAAQVARWLQSHPTEKTLLVQLEGTVAEHVAASAPANASIDVDAALSRALRRLDDPPALSASDRVLALHGEMRFPPRRWWIPATLAAAGVLAAVTFASQRRARDVGAGSVAASVALRDYRTFIGATKAITLDDGSRVILGPDSRLQLGPAYGRGAREMTLEGLASFAVRHDDAAPFIVHIGSVVVRDVGTEFTVRAPSAGSVGRIRVAVLSGAVSLSARGTSGHVSLAAGDRAEVRDWDGAVSIEHGVVDASDTAWSRGVLRYRNATLDLVSDDLARWYGVRLEVTDSTLAQRHVTAEFERQPVDQLLDALARAIGAEVRRTGNVATLRPAAGGA